MANSEATALLLPDAYERHGMKQALRTWRSRGALWIGVAGVVYTAILLLDAVESWTWVYTVFVAPTEFTAFVLTEWCRIPILSDLVFYRAYDVAVLSIFYGASLSLAASLYNRVVARRWGPMFWACVVLVCTLLVYHVVASVVMWKVFQYLDASY
jgi:hypothetical protein